MSDSLPRPATPPPGGADKGTDVVSGLDAPAGRPTVPSDHPNAPHPAVADAPQLIGDYVILQKIGEGGMGAVYLAEDTRLGRKAAVKTLRRELAANQTCRDRFEREARGAAKLDHDNIVPIWYVGTATDGSPFMAMPFLQGESLDMRLARVPVAGVGLILKVAREVASGLAAAHAKGLVHRDVKPANIWLEGDPSAPALAGQIRRCKILDFGLVRSAGDEDAQITAPGQSPGTPAFMSPEQARGLKVDHRADLWSLGVTLYRMATGRLPFGGPSAMAVLIALTTETPPPVRELAPDLPPALAELIVRLMAKDPAGRPQSAAEVAATVRQIAKDLQAGETRFAPTPVPLPEEPPPPTLPLPVAPPAAESVSASAPQLLQTVNELPEPDAAPEPVRPTRAVRRLPWVAAVVGLLALVPLGLWLAGAFNGKKTEGEVGKTEPPPAVPPKKEPPKTDPPKQEQPKQEPVGDSERAAALFVLSCGGHIEISIDDQDVHVEKIEELPKDPFHLNQVVFPANARVTDAELAVFKNCRHVTLLSVNSSGVGDAGLAHFAGCRWLTYVYIRGTGISPRGLDALKDCPEIQELNLIGTQVDDATLADIKRFAKLDYLYLQGTKVTAAGVADLVPALHSEIAWDGGTVPCATEADRKAAEWVLTAGGTVQIDKPGNEVKSVKALPKGAFKLVDLSLTAKVPDSDLAVLTRCKHLTGASLIGTGITNTGLAHLQYCTNLKDLYLSGTQVDEGSVPVIKQFTKLTYLSVGVTEIGEKGVKEIAKALPGCTIQWNGGTLEVGSEGDREAALYVLSVKGKLRANYEERDLTAEKDLPKELFRLTAVDLRDNTRVTDAGLAIFKDCKNLTWLSLWGTKVGDGGLAHFKDCKNLTYLDLDSTQVSNAGLAHLKEFKNLAWLDLDHTRVSDAGLAHLKECKNLSELFLEATQVSNAGLAHLKDCEKLRELYLKGTQVDDAGLAQLKRFTKLTYLDVEKTEVTAKGVTEFAKASPKCKIIWHSGTIEPKK